MRRRLTEWVCLIAGARCGIGYAKSRHALQGVPADGVDPRVVP